VELYGKPFFLHPPIFFFLEAIYARFFLSTGDVIDQVQSVRHVNVLLAGVSAGLLYLIGRSVAGTLAGTVAAALFAVDPFVIRLNSRNYLETCSITWILAGYALLFTGIGPGRERVRLSRRRAVAVGVAFGLGLLTKDMTAFLTLVPMLICFVLSWCIYRRNSLLIIATTVLTYAVYPLTVIFTGHWSEFEQQKIRGLSRFSGSVQETGFNQVGGPSFAEAIIGNLLLYGTTYLLFGVGLIAVVYLLFLRRSNARLLATWCGSTYILLAYSITSGTLEEQFFYFLVVPAIAASAAGSLILHQNGRRLEGLRRSQGLVAGLCLTFFVFWSLFIWVRVHFTPDNGYEVVRDYLEQHVPAGSVIAATTETGHFVLEGYASGPWIAVDQLRDNDVEYVIMSTKQIEEPHSVFVPDQSYFDWVDAHGVRVMEFEGPSNGLLVVYRLVGFDTRTDEPLLPATPITPTPTDAAVTIRDPTASLLSRRLYEFILYRLHPLR